MKLEKIIVIFSLLLYTLAACLVSLNRYWQFNAFWYDFGIFDTAFWKLSRFQLPVIEQLAPPQGKIIWADHFDPSTIFIAPFYWLTQKQEIIFIVQVLAVTLSAWIIYKVTREKINSALARLAIIAGFLGFIGMQNALYSDVHSVTYAVLPLTLAIWAIYKKNWPLYWITLAIFLGFKENLTAIGVGLGIFLILRKDKQIKIGLATIIISVIYGFLCLKVIIPFFASGGYSYPPAIPATLAEAYNRLLFPWSQKGQAILVSFATFGLLPLVYVPLLPVILAQFVERFVFNLSPARFGLGLHYSAVLSPLMAMACIEVISVWQKKKQLAKLIPYWGLTTILIVVFIHRFWLHGPLMLSTHPYFYLQTRQNKFLQEFAQRVPTNGLLMIQNNLASHFSHYQTILLGSQYSQLSPDVIVIDGREGQNPNNFYPISENEARGLIKTISQDPNYENISPIDSQYIFVKKKLPH